MLLLYYPNRLHFTYFHSYWRHLYTCCSFCFHYIHVVRFFNAVSYYFKFENVLPLRKHAYSNILKILPPKNENFQIKHSDIFPISAQNTAVPQIMLLSRNKKNNVYPNKPQFYYIKVRFNGVKII